MREIWLAFGVAGALAVGSPTAAQVLPVAVDLRGVFAFPTGEFGDDARVGAESGAGFAIDASLALTPGLSVYGGWSRLEFGSDTGGVLDLDFIDSGFHGGLQVAVPVGILALRPWVRGGAVYHEVTVDLNDEVLEDEFGRDLSTGHALGFEVGVGADLPLGQVISFTPEVAYRSYDADSVYGDGSGSRVSYLSAGLGMKFRF